MQQNALGSGHPQFALTLYRLARVYIHQRRFVEAKQPMEEAIAIFERTRVPNHPDNVVALGEYAHLLRKIGRKPEAKDIEKRIAAIKTTGNVDNFGGHTVDVQALR